MAVRQFGVGAALILLLTVSACGQFGTLQTGDQTQGAAATGQSGGLLRTSAGPETTAQRVARERREQVNDRERRTQSLLGDLFIPTVDPNTTIQVNKYIWNASLDVLDFLPIESVDPFSGVIVTGFGTPPGGRTPYRATIFVRDPALEARSLNIALATRAGPASAETVRAVEDAILSRARQLRIADLNL